MSIIHTIILFQFLVYFHFVHSQHLSLSLHPFLTLPHPSSPLHPPSLHLIPFPSLPVLPLCSTRWCPSPPSPPSGWTGHSSSAWGGRTRHSPSMAATRGGREREGGREEERGRERKRGRKRERGKERNRDEKRGG